jgi:hypothetical protein
LVAPTAAAEQAWLDAVQGCIAVHKESSALSGFAHAGADGVVMAGVLTKLGYESGKWQARFFTLQKHGGLMCVFMHAYSFFF